MEPYFIYRSTLDEMTQSVIDEETGMTDYDLFECQHANDDSVLIVEDTSDERDHNGCYLVTSFNS